MCPVNKRRHIGEQARTIFSRLGYTVSGDGEEFRAERDWKVVYVTTNTDVRVPPGSDRATLRCFVTKKDRAKRLRRRVADENPEYEWAVIGVDDDEEYEVERAPAAAV
ncbi:DUF7116 family protein [Haloarchaeobius sp. TZWWS8]|uniref:DUF7116 family protein n=1 Tax=Haloarchaeobius sp. TZWWS8 TaxID=3446121 RepID=UPI003EB8D130